jgi:8-oxo-dGTP diphosphatase
MLYFFANLPFSAKTVPMFQGKVRVRAVGLLIEDNRLLLLKHSGLGPQGFIWSPPGGGVEFGLSAEETVIKEFREETHLKISVERFLFVNEHRDRIHHAVELFFEVRKISGTPTLGSDPEINEQILTEINYFTMEELRQLPSLAAHSILSGIDTIEDVLKLKGYYKFAQL